MHKLSFKTLLIILAVFIVAGITVGVLMVTDNIPYSSCRAWDGGVPGNYCDAPVYTTFGSVIFFLAPISFLGAVVTGALIVYKDARKDSKAVK